MKGLIIKDPWITKILNGEKVWEIRGSNTNIRGTIGLIKSGTGKVFGTAKVVESFPLTDALYDTSSGEHRIPELMPNHYKQRYARLLQEVEKYDEPIPYEHKQGCVIWVNL